MGVGKVDLAGLVEDVLDSSVSVGNTKRGVGQSGNVPLRVRNVATLHDHLVVQGGVEHTHARVGRVRLFSSRSLRSGSGSHLC